MALNELQETAKNLRINITKNVTHCFILNGKELPIHYQTIADVFRDVFVMLICRLLRSYIFCKGHVVIEAPITKYFGQSVSRRRGDQVEKWSVSTRPFFK